MLRPDAPLPEVRPLGNIRTYLRGRCFYGPDWQFLVAALIVEVATVLLFVAYTNLITAARVITGILAPLVVLTLFRCSSTNPGVARKRSPPSPTTPTHEPVVTEVVYVRGDGAAASVRVEQTWCYSCNTYRSIRSVHCRFCDVCVQRRDHHCPWTGICVGAGNYLSYFLLVWLAFAQTLTMFIGGVHSFITRVIDSRVSGGGATGKITGGLGTAVGATYGFELLLIVASLGAGVLVGSLAVFHAYLIMYNMTSGDVARKMPENIYNRGSIWANVREAFGGVRDGGEQGVVAYCHEDANPVIVNVEEESASPVEEAV